MKANTMAVRFFPPIQPILSEPHACRYLEHMRKKTEEEARIMKDVSCVGAL